MKTIYLLVVTFLLLALATGCSVDTRGEGMHVGDPVREVRAEATAVAVDTAKGNADLDLQIREAELEAEKAAHVVALEATRTAYTTQMQSQLIVATVQAGANAEAIRARGEAEASTIRAHAEADIRTSRTLADAGAIAIPMVAVGLAVAFVILAWGHSTATVKRAVLSAGYVRIGVEPSTLLPPPLVIHNGFLVDTRSGERAKLSDPAGIDRMRLAATAHATEVALTTRSLVSVAKATKSAKPGDMLPSVAGAIPMLVNEEAHSAYTADV